MPLKLMYITNDSVIAAIAENAGVDRIFIDMEYIDVYKRQSAARFIFDDLVADINFLLLPIDRRPFQAENLASPQSVISGEDNYDPQRIAVQTVDQLFDFFGVVVAADILLGFRAVCLVAGIGRNEPPLYGVLERKMQKGVIPCLLYTSRCV